MTKNLIFGAFFATVSNLLILVVVARTLPVSELDLYLQVFGFFSLSIGILSGFVNYTSLPAMRSGASVEVTFVNFSSIFLILIFANFIFGLIYLQPLQAILGTTLATIMVVRTFLVSSLLASKGMYLFGNVTVSATQLTLCSIVILLEPSTWYAALILFEFFAILSAIALVIKLDVKFSKIDRVQSFSLRNILRESLPNFSMFLAFSSFGLIDSIYANSMPDGLYANINLVHRFGIAFVTIFLNPIAIKIVFTSLEDHNDHIKIRSDFIRFVLLLLLFFGIFALCVYFNRSHLTALFSRLFEFNQERARQLTGVCLWYIPGLALMSVSTVLYRIMAAFRMSSHFAIISGVLWPATYVIGVELMHLPQTTKFPISFFTAWLVSLFILYVGFSQRSNKN